MRIYALLTLGLLAASPAWAASDDDDDDDDKPRKERRDDDDDAPRRKKSEDEGGGGGMSFARANQGDLAEKPTLAEVLPAKGDIGLTFDATPTLNYVGSIIAGGASGAGLAAYENGFDQTIVAKYFLSEGVAARARFGFKFESASDTSYYDDPIDLANGDDPTELSDTTTTNEMRILVGGGVELRRGYRRLQGYIGGEGALGLETSASGTTYGYAYDQDAADAGVVGDGTSRPLTENSGMKIILGGRGFAGVEYFVLPKISLGMEYGFGLHAVVQGRGSAVNEVWDGEEEDAFNETSPGSGSGRHLGLDVDNGINDTFDGDTGAVTLNFHF
jgi:hypothetical protein